MVVLGRRKGLLRSGVDGDQERDRDTSERSVMRWRIEGIVHTRAAGGLLLVGTVDRKVDFVTHHFKRARASYQEHSHTHIHLLPGTYKSVCTRAACYVILYTDRQDIANKGQS